MLNLPDDPLADVSRETLSRLERLQALTLKWTRKVNLIAPLPSEEFWDRHIRDSAQLWKVKPEQAETWIDLGSGGGFPGLVIAALAYEKSPDLEITLVDSDQRKCVFLRQAARELGFGITVLNARIETVKIQPADVISARALAALKDILRLSTRFTKPSTRFILPKGKTAQAELEAAQDSWSFKQTIYQSVTDSDARLLVLSDVFQRT